MKRVVFLMMVVGLVGIFDCAYGQTYVDLGLSSGTKWKDVNAKGYYTWDEAMELFGDKMPTKAQWEELKRECKWTWEKGKNPGMRVTGPNGNRIFLPAAGFRDCGGGVYGVGSLGAYWSSTTLDSDDSDDAWGWGLIFISGDVVVDFNDGCYGRSVRLVQD